MYKRRLRKKRFFVLLLIIGAFVLSFIFLSGLLKGNEDKAAEAAVMDIPTASPAAFTPLPVSTPIETPKPQTQRKDFAENITARCAVLIDTDGNVLYSKNANSKAYPASTTKVLTALIALENGNLNDIIRVGDEANMPKPDSSIAGLRYGEKLSLLELVHALLIPSGNDAAYVLAANIGRATSTEKMSNKEAVTAFVTLMNKRAKELGATNSHFTVPDGFSDDQNYTTAHDMALIARAAMKNQTFAEIVQKRQYQLPDLKIKDKDGNEKIINRMLHNTNDLLDPASNSYLQSCTGIKTGYTGIAGFCLVASASKNGETFIAVVFDSTKTAVWQDARSLLVWALNE